MTPMSPAPAAPQAAPPVENPLMDQIPQIAADTGYTPKRIMQDIAHTGSTTKEELYPALYSGQGIQPMDGQSLSSGGGGVMQGQPAPAGDAEPDEDDSQGELPPAAAAAPAPSYSGPTLSPEGRRAMQAAGHVGRRPHIPAHRMPKKR